MTLENIVKGTLVAGLVAGSVYAKDVNAQEPSWLASSAPESVCAQRYDTLFSSGSEPLTQVVPAGVQNCASLESTFDPTRSAGSSITVSLVGDQSYDFALVKTLPGESAHGQYSAVGIPSFASFDSEYGVLSLSPSCDDVGFHPGGSYNVFDSDMPLVINYDVRCGVAPVLDGVDLDSDGVADLVNSGGSLPDFVWLRDFPVTVGLVGDAGSYSASLGSVVGSDWSLNESVGGSYTLTAHRDGLEDSASGSLLLRDAVLERLGANDFVSGSASFSIPCGSEYSGELVTNTDDLSPSVTDTYSSSNLPAGASVSGDVFSYTPSCDLGSPENVSFGLTPTISSGGNNKTLDEYLVDLTITGVDQGPTFTINGLDFENDGSVSSTPYHGTWDDSNNDGVIDQPVKVREGRGPSNPWEAYVLASDGKSVTLDPQSTLPGYINVSGNMIEFGTGGSEGESGSLEFLVCDEVDTSDCAPLSVPYEIVPTEPQIVGLSYTEENGTIDNPVDGGFFDLWNTVDCQLPVDERYVVATPYDFEYNFDINDPAPNMGIHPGMGRISFNADCDTQLGQTYFPQVRVTGSGGQSTWKTAKYEVE